MSRPKPCERCGFAPTAHLPRPPRGVIEPVDRSRPCVAYVPPMNAALRAVFALMWFGRR